MMHIQEGFLVVATSLADVTIGNFRTLKWRYCNICLPAFFGVFWDSLKFSPCIGLIIW